MRLKRVGPKSVYIFHEGCLQGWVYRDAGGYRWSPMRSVDQRGPVRPTEAMALADASEQLLTSWPPTPLPG